jgi:hypothetical protein
LAGVACPAFKGKPGQFYSWLYATWLRYSVLNFLLTHLPPTFASSAHRLSFARWAGL